MRIFSGLTFFMLSTLVGHTASAVTLNYTGQLFDSIQDSPVITGTYSTSNQITGFLELSSPLAANLAISTAEGSDLSNVAVDYSFTDGRQTFSKGDFALGSGLSTISFSTDASGNITGWLLQFINQRTGFGDLGGRIYADGSIEVGEITSCTAFNNCTSIAVDQGSVLGGGVWEVQEPAVVPLPSTLPLLLCGAGLVGLMAGRRRQPEAR